MHVFFQIYEKVMRTLDTAKFVGKHQKKVILFAIDSHPR